MQYRTRDLLICQRTQLIDALRAHLSEPGIAAARRREGVAPTGRITRLFTALHEPVRVKGFGRADPADEGRLSGVKRK
jgi:hypothetical protein